MSKISLSQRKRLGDLQGNLNTSSYKRQKDIVMMKSKYDAVDETPNKSESNILSKEDSIIIEKGNAFVIMICKSYEKWSKLQDNSSYRYSPQKRHEMLLKELKVFINEVSEILIKHGLSGKALMVRCQSVVNGITKTLKESNIPIGDLIIQSKKE